MPFCIEKYLPISNCDCLTVTSLEGFYSTMTFDGLLKCGDIDFLGLLIYERLCVYDKCDLGPIRVLVFELEFC